MSLGILVFPGQMLASVRSPVGVSVLDLLTEFFGLKTTRAETKVQELTELQKKARSGDRVAARRIILALAEGTEVRTP